MGPIGSLAEVPKLVPEWSTWNGCTYILLGFWFAVDFNRQKPTGFVQRQILIDSCSMRREMWNQQTMTSFQVGEWRWPGCSAQGGFDSLTVWHPSFFFENFPGTIVLWALHISSGCWFQTWLTFNNIRMIILHDYIWLLCWNGWKEPRSALSLFVSFGAKRSPSEFQVLAGECFRQAGGLLLNADGNRFCNESGPTDPLAAQWAAEVVSVFLLGFLELKWTALDIVWFCILSYWLQILFHSLWFMDDDPSTTVTGWCLEVK